MKEIKELLVISGKGGTGKTSIVGAFAVLAKDKVFADCDVDAADLHLLLKPIIRETHEFRGSKKAVIDQEKCAGCGRCAELCRFQAITGPTNGRITSWTDMQQTDHSRDKSSARGNDHAGAAGPGTILYKVDPVYCEGCEVCYHACPRDAITMEERVSGHWFISDTPYGPMIHARLGIAEENSGKLVSQVRQAARAVAEEQGSNYIIIDGPPGIGCPVVSSISGVDLILAVTEPTVSGKHDLERVLELARHFGVEARVCINKYDLDVEKAAEIERYCQDEGVKVAGKIPFDEDAVKAIMNGMSVVEYGQGPASRAIRDIWQKLDQDLKEFIPQRRNIS